MKAWKWGCGGCVLIVVFFLLLGGGTIGLGWMQSQNVHPESVRWEATPEASEETGPSGVPDPSVIEVPVERKPPVKRLYIEVISADLELVPADAGTTLVVEADFDPKFYRLEHEQGFDENGTPQTKVRFEGVGGGGFMAFVRQIFIDNPTLVVQVPTDAFGTLAVDAAQGEAELDLTGLELVEADLDCAQGALIVKIDEETPYPYRRFVVDGAQGAIVIGGLGNASPAITELEQSMGALVVDARGAWRNDGTLSMEITMGNGDLTVPDDITVTVEGVSLPGITLTDPEIPLPVLKVDTSESSGEVRVRRK